MFKRCLQRAKLLSVHSDSSNPRASVANQLELLPLEPNPHSTTQSLNPSEDRSQEAAANLGRALQARLDGHDKPGSLALKKMRMQVNERPVSCGNGADRVVHARMVRAGQRRIDFKKVLGVVAERRVVHVAEEDRPDGKLA